MNRFARIAMTLAPFASRRRRSRLPRAEGTSMHFVVPHVGANPLVIDNISKVWRISGGPQPLPHAP